MRRTDDDDAMIAALLDDVARVEAEPDAGLMARVMADAARAPGLANSGTAPGVLQQLREVIGGWPALGGLTLAGCAGLWMGVAPPMAVEELAATLLGTTETVSLWSGADALELEGFIDG